MTVYIQKEKVDHVVGVNDSGAALEQYEFAIVGPYAAIADEDIASLASGSYHVEKGIQFQVESDDLKAGELTFGTAWQNVYWDATTGEFSDTETAGYYLIGHLVKIKDSNGMIVVEKYRYAELVTS